jgi:peroxiredoxin
MEQGIAVEAVAAAQPGELLPDFFGRAADGSTLFRREYKGRRHLVLCFAASLPAPRCQELLAALVSRHPSYLAAGAEVVVFQCDNPPTSPLTILADPNGRMHARYGATSPLLITADRYGEIVLRRPLDDLAAALDEALASVEWMQTRCSL